MIKFDFTQYYDFELIIWRHGATSEPLTFLKVLYRAYFSVVLWLMRSVLFAAQSYSVELYNSTFCTQNCHRLARSDSVVTNTRLVTSTRIVGCCTVKNWISRQMKVARGTRLWRRNTMLGRKIGLTSSQTNPETHGSGREEMCFPDGKLVVAPWPGAEYRQLNWRQTEEIDRADNAGKLARARAHSSSQKSYNIR